MPRNQETLQSIVCLATREKILLLTLKEQNWCIIRQNPCYPQQYRVVFFTDQLDTWRCFERNNGLQLQTATSDNNYTTTVILNFDSMFLFE